jgi:hypothetical protein
VPVERVVEGFPMGEKIMELKIYRSTKKADLDKLINEAKTNGVELEFNEIKYNEKNQLVNISGIMKKGSEKSSFNASDFVVVRLVVTKIDGKFSINIFVSDKGEVS